jgi:hypothetical protein
MSGTPEINRPEIETVETVLLLVRDAHTSLKRGVNERSMSESGSKIMTDHAELAGCVFDGRVWDRGRSVVNIFGMAEAVKARRRRTPVRMPATSRGWRA